METWSFINHISLMLCYRLFAILREKDLLINTLLKMFFNFSHLSVNITLTIAGFILKFQENPDCSLIFWISICSSTYFWKFTV